MEYKIITHKYFDSKKDRDVEKYYVKILKWFLWWYKINNDEIIFNLLYAIAHICTHIIFSIFFHFPIYMHILSLMILIFTNIKIYNIENKEVFYNNDDALNYIKKRIKISQKKYYNTTEEVKIKFIDGKITIEK